MSRTIRRRTGAAVALSALSMLACMGGTDTEPLLNDLQSINPAVRQDAVEEAATMIQPEVTTALEAMLEDPDPKIRLAAVVSLDKHASITSVRPLMAHVIDDDPDVSREVIDTLGRMGDPAAAPAIMASVSANIYDPPLNAVWALGEVGSRDAITLLTRLRNHPDPWVEHSATEALRKLE